MNSKEKEDIKRYLAVIKRASHYIEQILENEDGGLLEEMMSHQEPAFIEAHAVETKVISPKTIPASEVPRVEEKPSQEFIDARNKHVNELLSIDTWPEAVDESITREPSEEDKINRARSVVDALIDRPIQDMCVLDFGCGDGWISSEFYSRGAKHVTGFDVKPSEQWSKFHSNIQLTSVWEEVENKFDIVFLYDVLDHSEDPELIMRQIDSVLKSDGIVYVRCHPWLSRHGSHLYNKGLNKSHIHLFLTYEEIANAIGEDPMFVRTEKDPVTAYKWWFDNFKIVREDYINDPISDFFKNPAFKDLLGSEHQLSKNEVEDLLKRMEINFVDFQLVK